MWEQVFLRVFSRFISVGAIELTLADGHKHLFGDQTADPIKVAFHDDDILREIIINADMGLGEGYMDGRITLEDDNLGDFLGLLVRNRSLAKGHLFNTLRRARFVKRAILSRNPIGRAKANVAHHYDLSGALYDLFLDRDKQYSCAYFETPDQTLEGAQTAKKNHIARKLALEPDMNVLDVGCGWGGMAITMARDFGVRVTGVTLSTEQHKVASGRVTAAGLQDRIDIRLQDYRQVNETFDRIVSVGMFEHVGARHYAEYFTHLDRLLGPEGVALIHTIGSSGPPQLTSGWITKYIFPGGHIPTLSEIVPKIEKTGLDLADLEVLRLHYAETLRHWYDRFMANKEVATNLYDERFVRMWRFYLKASEMTFRHGGQVVFQMQLARRNDSVPLTRNYLYETNRKL